MGGLRSCCQLVGSAAGCRESPRARGAPCQAAAPDLDGVEQLPSPCACCWQQQLPLLPELHPGLYPGNR